MTKSAKSASAAGSSEAAAASTESARRSPPMKLLVRVVEARGLPAVHVDGSSDPFVKLQLGKRRAKTAVVKRSLAPVWDEEFSFLVGDVAEELVVTVFNEDRYFSNDVLGRVRVPLARAMETDDLSLGTAWYQLQPKSKKSKKKCRGEVCLRISLSTRTHVSEESQGLPQPVSDDLASSSDRSNERKDATLSTTSSFIDLTACASLGRVSHSSFERLTDASIVDQPGRNSLEQAPTDTGAAADNEAMSNPSSVVEVLSRYFFKKADAAAPSVASDTESVDQLPESKVCSEDRETPEKATSSESSLDELLKIMESKDQGSEMPGNLPGGVLVDESYVTTPAELNSLLFSGKSDFWPAVSELQGTSGFQIEPWKLDSSDSFLQRTLTYTKAASKLVKAVKATEEQKYLKAAGNSFAVLSVVSTPDVPCGNCFKVEILYCITPGPQLSSEEQTSHLTISWRVNFVQSTMIKGMIENGAKQGMTEGFAQFSEVLSQKLKVAEPDDANSYKEKILASLHAQKETGWRLIVRFLGNFTFIFSVIIALYVIAHLHLSKPDVMHGLEYFGLDLPDSIGEVVVCAVLILQGQNIVKVIRRFLNAWKQRGSDHGVKAHGDGWLLTVALIEGSGIRAAGSSDLFDLYVVFTCNTKKKTSSIKFQTSDPKWNEVFEFDAMDDPPSRMDIAIYDSSGPSTEIPIGHTEVNFLKNNLSDLTDIWLPLDGKCDQASNPKLHLRIFLNNSRGTEVVMNYLAKMGKEVGKKIHLRSTQTNAAFRKLFMLPPEEFLIDDFTCHLKRKMPLQGRLFFSPRIVGFYSNIFGHKTKFFFLWEDVDDIQVIPPTLSIGSPSLMIILRKDRGAEAKHGAKGTDHHGRLKFHFQSFVSFNDAYRIITAIWKIRAIGPEQKAEAIEKDELKEHQPEEGGSLFTHADVKMSEIFSSVLSVDVDSLMEMFSGGPLEHKVMQKAGCLDYSTTEWELVGCNIQQRQTSYKFDKSLSRYGGEATTTQQKYTLVNRDGWAIEEVMTLQGVLLGDYFSLQLKYHMVNVPSKPNTCSVQVLLGIAWLKSTKQQKKVTKNVISNSSNRLKELFAEVEKELTSRNGAS
ncbi:hypothetical protein ACP70R_043330 [Stipagrostis hirtigluma subsp. patula]